MTNSHNPNDHSDDSDHSGEIIFNAPLPFYERTWRHPSEITHPSHNSPSIASNAMRSFTSFAAITSVALSLTLLWVVTPQSGEPRESLPDQMTFSLQTTQSNKTNIAIGILDQSSAFALPLTTSGYFISANANLIPNSEVLVRFSNGRSELLRVLEIDKQTGIVWLHSVDTTTHHFSSLHKDIAPPQTALAQVKQGDQIFIASPTDGVNSAIIAISSTNTQQQAMWPVDYSLHDHCSGAAVNSAQHVIGWCVEIDGARWVVPTRLLAEMLHRLETNAGQP